MSFILSLALIVLSFLLADPVAASENPSDLQTVFTHADSQTDALGDRRDELNAFYALRGYHPAWNLREDAALQKMNDFLESITSLITYHGLAPAHYPLGALRALIADKNRDATALELLTTRSLLQLTHDLHGDGTDLAALYTGWVFHRASADMPHLLNDAVKQGNVGTFFDEISTHNPAYHQLASALQTYRGLAAQGPWPTLSGTGIIHIGDSDPRVPNLRRRLAAEGYAVPAAAEDQENIFDAALSQVLTVYQDANGLNADGALGEKTQEALNIPLTSRINQIRANMERLRHMPENYPPKNYFEINIPAYSLNITEAGHPIHIGIVVVGRKDRQTPFIASKITNMLVNPSWHVPIKIARKDILPKLKKNPHYLEDLGAVIVGREEDPAGTTIDWARMKPEAFHFTLRQNPGDMNSLGQLKFNFANSFDVYMHGTPHQELFDKAERAFSSGCIRLEDPVEVGAILLAHTTDAKGPWNQQRIQDSIDSNKSFFVSLAKPMPIMVSYWSVFVDADGVTNFRKDIYGYDAVLSDQMNNTEQ